MGPNAETAESSAFRIGVAVPLSDIVADGSPIEEELPDLPLSEARVEGTYRGFGLFADRISFVPRCRKGGACDVVGTSNKGGARFEYDGGYSANYDYDETCASGGLSTGYPITLQWKFKISKAEYDRNDVWRATQLKVVQRANSPGATQTYTGTTTIQTLTCDPLHEKDRGTMSLAGKL